MDCRQESCEAEGCGWESRCTQSSLTPTVWVTLSPMWLQDTTVRNTCCNPFLPFDFCPPDASPPVRHSGQLTSHHVVVHVGRPAITTISYARLTPPPSQAPRGSTWMQTERPIAREQKTHRGPKDLPRSEHLWNDRLCPPAGSCAGNMGKFSKMGLLLFSFYNKNRRTGRGPHPASPRPAHDRTDWA